MKNMLICLVIVMTVSFFTVKAFISEPDGPKHFQPGALVRVISGGPPMIVTNDRGRWINCMYYNHVCGEFVNQDFTFEQLERSE